MAAWSCLSCPESGDGLDYVAADKAAEKHTKATTHPTITSTVGAIRRRDEHGRVTNHKPKKED